MSVLILCRGVKNYVSVNQKMTVGDLNVEIFFYRDSVRGNIV
jgi:hypothetical protein